MTWNYTQRDGRTRTLTIQPAVIIDAKREGLKWHPDMRERFGKQCGHGAMMQIRESAEWRTAVIEYARAHEINEELLIGSMCKRAKQSRVMPPPLPPAPPKPQPKRLRRADHQPGDLVIDDGGREAWVNSPDHIVMQGDLGDCATRAMEVTLRGTDNEQSYGTICKDVIKGKQRLYSKSNPWGYGKEWLKNNYSTPTDVIRSLMQKYTAGAWTMITVKPHLGQQRIIKNVAKILAPLKNVMLLSQSHIVAVKDGVIYDSWNSRMRRAGWVICRQVDGDEVIGLLRGARR